VYAIYFLPIRYIETAVEERRSPASKGDYPASPISMLFEVRSPKADFLSKTKYFQGGSLPAND
jgi:hypothetical protein